MREGLTILLVLGMVSAAGATSVWFEFDPASPGYVSPTEVATGTTATINLVADFTVESMDVSAITVDNSDTSVANQGVASVGTPNLKLTYRPLSSPGTHKGGIAGEHNIVIFQMAGGVFIDDPGTPGVDESIPPDPGEVLYTFDIAAGAAGSMIIVDDLSGPPSKNPYLPIPLLSQFGSPSGNTGMDIGSLSLTVVPEPATVALLGLGMVVFLRKR